jgi:hypothetical protein
MANNVSLGLRSNALLRITRIDDEPASSGPAERLKELLMPGRPNVKQLAQAQGRVVSLAQCDRLQRALRQTIAALRNCSDPSLSLPWTGNRKPARMPRVDEVSIRSAEDQLLHALAEARVSGEVDDVECRHEIAMAGSLESWAGAWSTSVLDSVEVSRRLVAWCTRAMRECETT